MKQTIGVKLGFAFGFFTVVILAIGIFGLWTGGRIHSHALEIKENWLPSAIYLGEINTDTSDFRILQILHAVETGAAAKARFEDRMEKELEVINSTEEKYKKLISSEKENLLYESFKSKWEKYLEIHHAQALGQTAQTAEDIHATDGLFDALSKDLSQLVKLNEEGGSAETLAAERTYKSLLWLSIILIAVAICMAVLFALKLTFSITKPLSVLVKATEAMAGGDLTRELNIQREDEIGDLAKSFGVMGVNLKSIVGQLLTTAFHVSSSSEELSAASEEMNNTTQEVSSTVQQIAKGAQVTAQRVEEASKVMEQMNASVSQVASGAQQAASASVQARQAAQKGNDASEETMAKMNSIFNTIMASAQVVKKLGTRSEEINEIVSVITDIADQTNLLALNAAIEAARAGEAGRGFAVVAEEVRKLAEGSAKAADQIAGLIKEIQKETGQAVDAMEAGSKEVAEGKEVVNESGKALKEIVKVVEHTASMVEQISAASEQMAAGTKQVVKAVDDIASNAEETAAATEEAAASTEEMTSSMEEMTTSAQELADMADRLRELGKKFKTGEKLEEPVSHLVSEPVLEERRKPLVAEWRRPQGMNGGRKHVAAGKAGK